jgi:hypothetical protein
MNLHSRSTACLLLLALIASVPLLLSPAFCQDEPLAQPLPRTVQFAGDVTGHLVELGKNQFTIQIEGKRKKIFRVGGIIVNGKRVADPESHSYRLDQLQIGDQLIVDYYHRDGLEIATYIRIRRRPGGVVPEQPETPRGAGVWAWHRQMNAFQDWEERGIHLPFEYETPYPVGLNPPYFRRPVAPPPREVGPPAVPPAAP